MSKRDFLSASDLGRQELEALLDLASRVKSKGPGQVLAGRTLGMLFFDHSLRTRVSFEVAMIQLGGHCVNLTAGDVYGLEAEEHAVMDADAEEHVKDAARTLSRYVDGLGIRQAARTESWADDRSERMLRAYARHASVPVINLETSFAHPCQAVADILTMRENLLTLRNRKLTLAWCNHPEPKSLGPTHSVVELAAMMGMDVTLAYPLGFEIDEEVLNRSRDLAEDNGGTIRIVNDLREAAAGAEVLYARSWGSIKYWEDLEREAMVKRSLQGWRIDADLMACTKDAILMHPLPVRRNVVATDDVLDSQRSVIYDQASNRLHIQKALLMQLLT
ncbi:MAG: N-acetylornithine carbamoyltransferase [Planctomycetota bacterium]